MKKFTSLARDSGVAFLFRGLGTASGLAMNLAISHSLGAAQAGYYFLALAIITFLSGLSRFGLDNALLRFIGAAASATEWGSIRSILRQSITIVTVISASLSLLIMLLADPISRFIFDKPELGPVLSNMALGLVGFSLCFIISFAFQGIRKVPASVWAQSLGIAVTVCASTLWISNAKSAAAMYTTSTLLVLISTVFIWRLYVPNTPLEVFPREKLLSSALPLWIVTITAGLQQWAGQFVAGALLPSEELAHLAVAQRTSFFISFFLLASSLVVAPKFSALHREGKLDELRSLAKASVRLVILFTMPFVLALLIWSDSIMAFFGPGFDQGSDLLRILVLGQVINAVTGPVGYLLIMSGNERDMRTIALICGPTAVALAFALTIPFGSTGAAVSTAIAVSLQNILAAFYVRKRLGFSIP